MSELKIKNADAADKYLGAFGTGATGNPYFTIGADFYVEVAKGNVYKHTLVHRAGHFSSVPTSFKPVAALGIYNTPQVSGATTLRIKAGGDANDTAAGTGARTILITGLSPTGALITETLTTAGVSASADTTATFIRLLAATVATSGTYATAALGSHAAAITIENGAGGTDWGAIEVDNFPISRAQIGLYTIPLGYTGYLLSAHMSVESTKIVNAIFFQRKNILETSTPYTSMEGLFDFGGVTEHVDFDHRSSLVFPALTDLGFMAFVTTGTADVSVDFELLLVQD